MRNGYYGKVTTRDIVYMAFKCEKCGEYTAKSHTVESHNEFETAYTQNLQNVSEGAKKNALLSLSGLKRALLGEPGFYDYKLANFKCRCDSCGQKPFFSDLDVGENIKTFDDLSTGVLSISVMFAVICFFAKWTLAGIVLSALGASLLIYKIVRKSTDKKKEEAVRTKLSVIDKKYLPIICEDEEALREKVNKHKAKYKA